MECPESFRFQPQWLDEEENIVSFKVQSSNISEIVAFSVIKLCSLESGF
jgi:hypothetical protein